MRINHKITLAMAAALVAANAWAVQAKRMPTIYNQADGKTVTLVLTGDESRHGITTTDGLALTRGNDGNYYYMAAGRMTAVMAHDAQQRTEAEQAFVAQHAAELTLEAQAAARPFKAQRKVTAMDIENTQVPHIGSPRIPIIMVNYTDYKFKGNDPLGTFRARYSNGPHSSYQYFVDQSFGKFTPQFDVIDLVQLSGERKLYGGNENDSPYGNDVGLGKMVSEACLALDSVDWSIYDNDKDGTVDVVIVLYAGVGEAQGGHYTSVWPCQWELENSDYGKVLEIGGVNINSFAVFNELAGRDDNGEVLDGIGTFCHEFSHCLGLPDFYATNNMGYYGMGTWSVMDYGNYNDDGNTPVGYTAYERNYLGWMDIEDAIPGSIINLKPITEGGKAYRIANDQDPAGNEYFIVECRKASGWEQFMASSGLMISHVDYDANAWAMNTVNNNGQRQRMTIVPADNKLSRINEEGDLYPYNGNDELTDNSTPPARVYTGSGSVKRLHKPITGITLGNDGSVTLKFMYKEPGDVNGDDLVDVADLNILIDIMLGSDSADNYGKRAYINGDDIVDIDDVNALIEMLITKQ